ncbi:MAG: helix-hairpin-helix domain-containing protein [Cyclobacteriaceae bacterium]
MIKLFKSLVRNHFGFSRAETNGMLLLFPLILITMFSPFLFNQYYNLFKKQSFLDEKSALEWKRDLEKNIVIQTASTPPAKRFDQNRKNTGTKRVESPINIKRFAFNPNTVSKKQLISLGFSQRVASNWINFRNKGARYHSTTDLRKIYGLDTAHLSSLLSLIEFDPEPAGSEQSTADSLQTYATYKPSIIQKDLNLTNSEDLEKISGIGEKLSSRIIKYRDQLGGFHHMDQLSSVYHLDSMVIGRIRENFYLEKSIAQIDINLANESQLALHPYFSRKAARVIVNYREQHGSYHSPEDLLKIHILNDSIVSKMSPYLRFAERNDIFKDQ